DLAGLTALFEARLPEGSRPAFWRRRMTERRIEEARAMLSKLDEAVAPLAALRARPGLAVADAARATVLAYEGQGRDADGGLGALYRGEAGEGLAGFLRSLIASDAPFALAGPEWPDVFRALLAPEVVKLRPGAERRIAIWG